MCPDIEVHVGGHLTNVSRHRDRYTLEPCVQKCCPSHIPPQTYFSWELTCVFGEINLVSI